MKHIASICAAAGQTQILASKGKNHSVVGEAVYLQAETSSIKHLWQISPWLPYRVQCFAAYKLTSLFTGKVSLTLAPNFDTAE